MAKKKDEVPAEVLDGITEDSKKQTVEAINEIPSHISGILKTKTMYESLYIDSHGGCFTPDTPKNIRGGAILYKNPYHKQ